VVKGSKCLLTKALRLWKFRFSFYVPFFIGGVSTNEKRNATPNTGKRTDNFGLPNRASLVIPGVLFRDD